MLGIENAQEASARRRALPWIWVTLAVVLGFFLFTEHPAWDRLHRAQQAGTLATTGPYAVTRHPQYLGFIAILLGFLLQWPTLLTLLMFPVLVVMYVRLARSGEREALVTFGEAYPRYMATTPGWLPRFARRLHAGHDRG